jgi:hypothetical protein
MAEEIRSRKNIIIKLLCRRCKMQGCMGRGGYGLLKSFTRGPPYPTLYALWADHP